MTVTARPTDLATALPGETSLDAALVAETVAAINATWRAGGLETARAVGALVVERFFGGDPKANAEALKQAGINSVFYVSPETAHEFLSWRRSLRELAPLLFND